MIIQSASGNPFQPTDLYELKLSRLKNNPFYFQDFNFNVVYVPLMNDFNTQITFGLIGTGSGSHSIDSDYGLSCHKIVCAAQQCACYITTGRYGQRNLNKLSIEVYLKISVDNPTNFQLGFVNGQFAAGFANGYGIENAAGTTTLHGYNGVTQALAAQTYTAFAKWKIELIITAGTIATCNFYKNDILVTNGTIIGLTDLNIPLTPFYWLNGTATLYNDYVKVWGE